MADDGIHIKRNQLIPLSDGVNVAADVYLPDNAGPFPVLFAYTVYRKDDLGGSFAAHECRFFARHGYACVLADFRGLGSSEGVAWDAMDSRESKDAAEIVEWIADQPWCDGGVGMWGTSYEAITSIEAAAQNPPHLKAIAPNQGAFDIYDSWFYPGGCANMLGAPGMWGSFMLGLSLMPPTLQDPEGRWYRIWKERLESYRPFMLPWPSHPDKDEYWQSRVIDVANIKVPTFVMGGWWDIFPEAMVSLYNKVSGPRKLLMGPWMHGSPDSADVEPVDHYRELLRWWDYWLKGIDTGIMDESPITFFVQGEGWKHENDWPGKAVHSTEFYLSGDRALSTEEPSITGTDIYQADPTVGTSSTLWDPKSLGVGRPLEQGPDDILSLTYTSEPLAEPLEIRGSPEVLICAAVEGAEDVNIVAKLCDVDEEGRSSQITTGWLKGSHHESHENAGPLRPDCEYQFRVPLWVTSYMVPRDHKLRLSISCSDFPRIWPTPSNPTIKVNTANSRVILPVVLGAPDLPHPSIIRPQFDLEHSIVETVSVPCRTVERDLANDSVSVRAGKSSELKLEDRGRFSYGHVPTASTSRHRPDGASVTSQSKFRFESPLSGTIELHADTWSSHKALALNVRITIDGHEFFRKSWRR